MINKKREEWYRLIRWLFVQAFTIILFIFFTAALIKAKITTSVVFSWYLLIILFIYIFQRTLTGPAVVASAAGLVGLFGLVFVKGWEGFLILGEIFLFPLTIWSLNRYKEREEDIRIYQETEHQKSSEEINSLSSSIDQIRENISSLALRINKYVKLEGVARILGTSLDTKKVIQIATESVDSLLGKGSPHFLLVKEEYKKESAGCFDNWVIEKKAPLVCEDRAKDFRFPLQLAPLEIQSVISVPVFFKEKLVAILKVESDKSSTFQEEDLRLLSIFGDLTSIAYANSLLFQRTLELAITDGLTGLYVQRFFKERLKEEILRAERFKTTLSLIMVDIDLFKSYNDKYGHQAGNEVLKRVADVFRKDLRETDIVCRYGGEEFSVLFPRTEKRDVSSISEKLRRSLAEEKFVFGDETASITISCGVANFPLDAQTSDQLIKKADRALYQAKQKGRNQVVEA